MSRQVALDGGDQRTAVSCPFNSAEEVWEFDAVEEYGLPEFYDLVRFYEDYVEQTRRERPGQLVTGRVLQHAGFRRHCGMQCRCYRGAVVVALYATAIGWQSCCHN